MVTVIQHPQLTTQTFNVMRDQGEDEFRREFGDEFVTGITTGGLYVGLVQYETQRNRTSG